MRIALVYLGSIDNIGGVETLIRLYLKELERRGYNCIYVDLSTYDESLHFDICFGFVGVDLALTKRMFTRVKAARYFAAVHMDPHDWINRNLRKAGIDGLIGLTLTKIYGIYLELRYLALNKITFVVLSNSYRDYFILRSRIAVLYNPREATSNITKLANQIKVMVAGRNSPQKRLDRAYKWKLSSSYEWTIFSSLESQWTDKELFSDKAVFLDYNVLVVSSDFEGWPLIIVEALQRGLYIMSTSSFGAITELIPNEKVGRVIPFDEVSIDKLLDESKEYILSDKYKRLRREHINSIVDDINIHVDNLVALWA